MGSRNRPGKKERKVNSLKHCNGDARQRITGKPHGEPDEKIKSSRTN